MDSFPRLPPKERQAYCQQAQTRLGLPPSSIEKDFWVCWALREFFTLPGWGARLTFKGGTSLSKGWRLIDRFSEDIDIVIDRGFLGVNGTLDPSTGGMSGKERKRRLEDLIKRCGSRIHSELYPCLKERFGHLLPADAEWNLEPDDSDPEGQTLLFHYPNVFGSSSAYLRPVVKIELGARSDTEPSAAPVIKPYLAEAFPELFTSRSFPVRALAPERTFWEKAALLHEEVYRPPEKPRKARLARHYYDLWCLITKGAAARAASDPTLFDRVVEHRRIFFRQTWMKDYSTLSRGSLKLVPPDDQMPYWRRDYAAMNEMFFGAAPAFDEMIRVVADFQNRFNEGRES